MSQIYIFLNLSLVFWFYDNIFPVSLFFRGGFLNVLCYLRCFPSTWGLTNIFLKRISYFAVNYFHYYIFHSAGAYFYMLFIVGVKLCIFPDRWPVVPEHCAKWPFIFLFELKYHLYRILNLFIYQDLFCILLLSTTKSITVPILFWLEYLQSMFLYSW